MNKVTQGQIDMLLGEASVQTTHRVYGKLCIVAVKLRNGFVITGESACVDPDNYDEKIGYDLACEQIESQLWELEGYALQKNLAGEL